MNDLLLTRSQFIVQCLNQTRKAGAAHNTIERRKIFLYNLHYLATSKIIPFLSRTAQARIITGFCRHAKMVARYLKYGYTVFNISFDTKEKYNEIANLMIKQLGELFSLFDGVARPFA